LKLRLIEEWRCFDQNIMTEQFDSGVLDYARDRAINGGHFEHKL